MTRLFQNNNINVYNLTDDDFGKIIKNIINESGLSNINIFITPNENINGFAQCNLFGSKSLVLTEGCRNLPENEIIAVVGHEISHIKNNDGTILSLLRRLFGGFLVFISLFLLIGLTNALIAILPTILNKFVIILFFPLILLYLIFVLFYFGIDGRRYWYQIEEIKADRKACDLYGVTCEGIINLLERLKKYNIYFKSLPWYKKIYFRYFEINAHPCLDRRIMLIKDYKKWSIIDYFKHFFVMIKWLITGRGWIGQ